MKNLISIAIHEVIKTSPEARGERLGENGE